MPRCRGADTLPSDQLPEVLDNPILFPGELNKRDHYDHLECLFRHVTR